MVRHVAKLFTMFRHARNSLVLLAVALAMTVLFWWPLYQGAGFIGGDLYPYFFPQKAFYADNLKQGNFPLWNDLSGFGYPVLGESQTGAAYPFHLVLYLCFDLNTAYNIEHLLHYVICFVGTWLLAKQLGSTHAGAYLTALVFTYGWFPPRACLEWAILTGAWLPVALWCVESFLQTHHWRYAIGLSVTIGLQLLAGHFHLAFVTQLLVVTYAAFRLWSETGSKSGSALNIRSDRSRMFAAVGLVLAMMMGAGLACIQLLPTWELKQRSSRVVSGSDYDPAYGHMPPLYVSQSIAPWAWYSPLAIDEDNVVRDIAEFAAPWHWFGPHRDSANRNLPYDLDQAIQQSRFVAVSAGTNKVESHFYCGIIPIWMAFCCVVIWFRQRPSRSGEIPATSELQNTTGYWLIAGLLALLYATGSLLPIGRHLPGFSFFRGPGRYGIVTTLAVALLSGQMLSRLNVRVTSRFIRILLMAMIFGSTSGDLWLVSRMVKYTVMVSPPISFRDASEVRRQLLAESQLPRLLAPGPNVGNLLGVSCVPWYLGIAPAAYVDSRFAMPPIPKPLADKQPTPATPELLEWLSRAGVTHVLNFEPLDEKSWHVERLWQGVDPFLNRVWGRQEPIYLYRFQTTQGKTDLASFPGRAYVVEGEGRITSTGWQNTPPDQRKLLVESRQGDRLTLVVTELAYPGWRAHKGSHKFGFQAEGMFRSIQITGGDDELVWDYRPRSVYIGAIISLATLILLAAIAHTRFWHPALLDRFLKRQ